MPGCPEATSLESGTAGRTPCRAQSLCLQTARFACCCSGVQAVAVWHRSPRTGSPVAPAAPAQTPKSGVQTPKRYPKVTQLVLLHTQQAPCACLLCFAALAAHAATRSRQPPGSAAPRSQKPAKEFLLLSSPPECPLSNLERTATPRTTAHALLCGLAAQMSVTRLPCPTGSLKRARWCWLDAVPAPAGMLRSIPSSTRP
mmetsp:Transcript_430/g.1104  ORF Transcript_430/g.1104 Transcript_430/m.1104 type:complete len:200 (-) Transcript_430:198-797(-)